MRIPYPKSFLTLLLIGFSLVTLPFLFAFVNASLFLRNITEQSQIAVTQAVQATRDSRLLAEQLTRMERVTRQYLVVGDSDLLASFGDALRSFNDTARTLGHLPLDREQYRALYEVTSRVDMIAAQVALEDHEAIAGILPEFAKLADETAAILASSNRMIERETAELQVEAERAQRLLMWQALSLIPFAVLVTLAIAYLIARPLRQIDQAIHDLGSGRMDGPIEVSGPEDLKQLGKRLDWLRQQHVLVEEQKNRFLREVSHELKTPLTAIREGAELLGEGVGGSLSDQQREIATILRDNSLRLQRLIEGLLNYSASRFHGVTEHTTVALRPLVQRVLEDYSLPISTRRLHLLPELEDVRIVGDESRLKTLCDNLISNAVKFAPATGIVKVALRKQNGQAVLEVLDNGPGIAPPDRPYLFEPFYQGSAPEQGRIKGSGLGLSIARDCVRAHGGSIEIVDNAEWAGAHFRVTLPLSGRTLKLTQ